MATKTAAGIGPRDIVQTLDDSPYELERKLSDDLVILRYGNVYELWVNAARRVVSCSSFVTMVEGRAYRFARRLRSTDREFVDLLTGKGNQPCTPLHQPTLRPALSKAAAR